MEGGRVRKRRGGGEAEEGSIARRLHEASFDTRLKLVSEPAELDRSFIQT